MELHIIVIHYSHLVREVLEMPTSDGALWLPLSLISSLWGFCFTHSKFDLLCLGQDSSGFVVSDCRFGRL